VNARGATLIVGVLLAASLVPAGADPLRHLDYRVSLSGDGAARTGTLHLDVIASRGEGAVVVDVMEELRDADASPIRVDINRGGGVATGGDQPLTDSELALVTVMALESENMNGVEVGDQWTRVTGVPRGRCTTTFKVMKNDSAGHIGIALSRTLQFADGQMSSWHGNVEYDANTFVPTAITFTGMVSAFDDAHPGLHQVSLTLRLLQDTFAAGIGRHEASMR
jgi:hypothetical protein